jgi:WD40 repeat protein
MRTHLIFLWLMLLFTLPVHAQTNEPITPENLDRLTTVARMGRGIIYDVAWSPDGTTIAAISANGAWLYNANLLDALPIALPDSIGGAESRIEFTSDGTRLYLLAQGHIQEWDMADLSQPSADYEVSGTLSADSRRVLHIKDSQAIEVLSLDSLDEPLRTLTGHTDSIMSVSISTDGTLAASSSLDGTVRLWNVDTGETLWSENVWEPIPERQYDWQTRDWYK